MQIKRWIPLLILLLLMIVVYVSGITKYFTMQELKANREAILIFVQKHPIATPLIFIVLYIVITALSVPIAVFVSIAGGFLFIQPLCTLYVVVGATCGATIVFLIAKTSIGAFFREKAGARLQKMEKEFQENGVGYLLFLRFVPLFPFWLVNIAPAFFGIRLWTFVITTFIGIIPGAFVFTQAGRGLGAILDANEPFSVEGILNLQVKIALIALGIFAIVPIVLKKMRKK